ncbi:MAG: hypothetical protein ACYDHP_13505 [Ferrimicrobium sp.]
MCANPTGALLLGHWEAPDGHGVEEESIKAAARPELGEGISEAAWMDPGVVFGAHGYVDERGLSLEWFVGLDVAESLACLSPERIGFVCIHRDNPSSYHLTEASKTFLAQALKADNAHD